MYTNYIDHTHTTHHTQKHYILIAICQSSHAKNINHAYAHHTRTQTLHAQTRKTRQQTI